MTAKLIEHAWSPEALFTKAVLYVGEMERHAPDDWLFAIWSSLALELLARAALAHVSPTLLASKKDWRNTHFALGYPPTTKNFAPNSALTSEVLLMLRELLPDFTEELYDFCARHCALRNAELHTGEDAFAVLDKSGWLTTFYAGCDVFLRFMGYERVEELEASARKSTRNAFVAMWFHESQYAIWKEAIEPAVEEAGYHAVRIDQEEHVNRIDDQIIAELKQSRFLVADFTGHRAGVYYEAGFMHGLGRNVIWLVNKKDLAQVHFDVRQYNFIDYDSPSDAKPRLLQRILAVEGPGPSRKTSTQETQKPS